jgi:hypothetical protein
MVIHGGWTNAPAIIRREMNAILPPLLGTDFVVDTKMHINEYGEIIVVAHINVILIATQNL